MMKKGTKRPVGEERRKRRQERDKIDERRTTRNECGIAAGPDAEKRERRARKDAKRGPRGPKEGQKEGQRKILSF
jgi:hypothetical protein